MNNWNDFFKNRVEEYQPLAVNAGLGVEEKLRQLLDILIEIGEGENEEV